MSKNILYHFIRSRDFIAAFSDTRLGISPLSAVLDILNIEFDSVIIVIPRNKKFVAYSYSSALNIALDYGNYEIAATLNKKFPYIVDNYITILESYFKNRIGNNKRLKIQECSNSEIEVCYRNIFNKNASNYEIYVTHDSIYESKKEIAVSTKKYGLNINIITDKNAIKDSNDGCVDLMSGVVGMAKEFQDDVKKKLTRTDDSNKAKYTFKDIFTVNLEVRSVIEYSRYISKYDDEVLILGETGTGKEMIAQAIHNNSKRKNEPFISINCAAIPETLFESEIFGIGPNVGTDVKKRIGKMEVAGRGTLFLDEIGDLSPNNQIKLLRALQEKKFTPIGLDVEKVLECRIICATNRFINDQPLNNFRNDLYYRINNIQIPLPKLKDRGENDIYYLLSTFLDEEKSRKPEYKDIKVSPEVIISLCKYSWPGNIRELKTFVTRSLSLAAFFKSDINKSILSFSIKKEGELTNKVEYNTKLEKYQGSQKTEEKQISQYSDLFDLNIFEGFKLGELLKCVEKSYLEHAIKSTKSLEKAGELIGYNRSTLWRKKVRYQL